MHGAFNGDDDTPVHAPADSRSLPAISSGVGGLQMTDDAIASACRVVLRGFGGTIDVDVLHGWVALRGDVARASDRWRAEERVGQVAGALGVSAQLTVRAHKRD